MMKRFHLVKNNKLTDEWERRKKVLIKTINHCMATIPEKSFNEKFLFYDA